MRNVIPGTPPFAIKWMKDKNEVCDTDCYRYVVYEDGGVALRLANVNPSDAGEYTCHVRNAFGESSCSGSFAIQGDNLKFLFVLSIIHICYFIFNYFCTYSDYKGASKVAFWFTKTPVPVLASKDETISFCARIQSERPIEIEWTINGKSARENYRCKAN